VCRCLKPAVPIPGSEVDHALNLEGFGPGLVEKTKTSMVDWTHL